VFLSLALTVCPIWIIGAAETKLDPTEENGLTHIVRIINTVNAIPPISGAPVFTKQRIEIIALLSESFYYKEDIIEHLQYPRVTANLLTGDCEDFTFFFLFYMKWLGQSLDKLGLLLLVSKGDNPSHIAAIYQDEQNEWWVWETGELLGQRYPLKWYLKNMPPFQYYVISFGLQPYNTVHIIDQTYWKTDYLGIWLKLEQERVRRAGLAYE